MNHYADAAQIPVSALTEDARATFIRRTYTHLLAAIAGFIALEYMFFTTTMAESILGVMLSVPWLVIMIGFIGVSWVAQGMADRAQSYGAQYAGLVLFVVAEAIFFVPLLWMAEQQAAGIIQNAAIVTGLGFLGLTIFAFTSKKDFSFLRGIINMGFMLALGAIVAGMIFGFQLGLFFDVAMVGLACGSILYNTSGVIRTYPESRYVGAALSLFAGVALLFWYVLRIFMSRD